MYVQQRMCVCNSQGSIVLSSLREKNGRSLYYVRMYVALFIGVATQSGVNVS